MIDAYLREFERWAVGSPKDLNEWRTELAVHLTAAEEAGELEEALSRLGAPREAAAAFSQGRRTTPAPLTSRWRAALIDYAPLILVAVGLAIWQFVTREGRAFGFTFPPVGIEIDSRRTLTENLVQNGVVLAAALWSLVGLALVESRNGRTPGKRAMGILTISEDGTAVSLKQTLIRRLPVLFWPVFWIDLITLGTARRQRVFELLAGTQVIADPAAQT